MWHEKIYLSALYDDLNRKKKWMKNILLKPEQPFV